MKRLALIPAAVLLLAGCALRDWYDLPPGWVCTTTPEGQIVCGPVTPSPSPAVSPSPAPTPRTSPSAVPTPRPSPTAGPTPVPPPTPTPAPCEAKPQCVNDEGTPTPDCTFSCAAWIAGGLAAGHLDPCTDGKPGSCAGARDRAYNVMGGQGGDRECFDTKTCNIVWCDSGGLRNRRPHRDGSICAPVGCSKVAPTPCPTSPPSTPPPTPSVPPQSPPSGGPPLTENGNYPVPPAGTCPAWFKDATERVGIRVAGQTACGQGTVCKRVTLWATQKSSSPWCEHRCYDEAGRYFPGACRDMRECELFPGCQAPQFIDYVGGDQENPGGGVLMQIAHPDWNNVWGRLDKQTCDTRHNACPAGMTNPVHNFNGHDKAVDRSGITRARACMPDGTKCSETSYRTDQ